MLDFGLGHHQQFLKNICTCENVFCSSKGYGFILARIMVNLEPITGTLGPIWEYTLDEMAVHHRRSYTHIHILIHTKGSLLYVEENPCGPKENMPTSTLTVTRAQD